MEILVDRYEESDNGLATIGKVYLDGVFRYYSLEDKVREIPGHPASEWKVKGETAITQGRYKVTVVWSPKHQCMVPLVNDVPGFSAIEIHWGNTDRDTEGCLLLGLLHKAGQDNVGASISAWNNFMPLLEEALGLKRVAVDGNGRPLHYEQVKPAEEVWITYRNSLPNMMVADAEIGMA